MNELSLVQQYACHVSLVAPMKLFNDIIFVIFQKEAADYREKLIISIMDRLCGVQSDLLYLSSLRKSIV